MARQATWGAAFILAASVLLSAPDASAGQKRLRSPKRIARSLEPFVVTAGQGYFGDSRFVEPVPGQVYFVGTKDFKLIFSKVERKPSLMPMRLDGAAIPAQWIAVAPDGRGRIVIAAAAYADRAVRMYMLVPSEQQLTYLSTVVADGNLRIDPTLIRVNDEWLLTATKIEGTANNADPAQKNGSYQIELFCSEDLKSWSLRSTILRKDKNLEDPRIAYQEKGNKLFLLYEEEEVDRGPSALHIITSADGGRSWTGDETVVSDGADNEPAGLLFEGQGRVVVFSSDRKRKGASYYGADPAIARQRRPSSEWIFTDLAGLGLPSGILLDDAFRSHDGSLYLAAIQNYGTAATLLWQQIGAVPK